MHSDTEKYTHYTATQSALVKAERAIAFIVNSTMALAAAGILVAVFLIGYSVVMRYVFNAAPTWVDDTIGFILVGIVMLSTASTLRKQKHICADTLTSRLGPRGLFIADMVALGSVVVVSVALIVNGWETSMSSKMLGIYTSGNVQIPIYWLQLMLPLGGILMLLVAVEGILRRIVGLPAADDERVEAHGGSRS